MRFLDLRLRSVQVVFRSLVFKKENLMYVATFGGARTPATAAAESKRVKSPTSIFDRFMLIPFGRDARGSQIQSIAGIAQRID